MGALRPRGGVLLGLAMQGPGGSSPSLLLEGQRENVGCKDWRHQKRSLHLRFVKSWGGVCRRLGEGRAVEGAAHHLCPPTRPAPDIPREPSLFLLH